MDCKFTSQSVKVSRTVFRQTLEQPFDEEFTLPDYCPDIRRVLKCRVVPKISQKSADGGCINLEGIACLNLIYVDPDGGIRSYESQSPFTKSVDFSGGGSNIAVNAFCRTDYCNCRAVNERTMDVHAAISISVSAVAYTDTNILTDIDEPSVQLLRGTAPASSPAGRCEKYLLINDEVSLPDKCPAIRNILRHDVTAVIKDKKIVGSKIVIKGELLMNVLYFGEETVDCERFSDSVPFSQILDISGITEDCTCTAGAELISAELNPRTGMSGDMRVVSVSAKIYLWAAAYCEGDVPYITDAYSTKYDMTAEHEDVCFERVSQSLSEPFTFKKTLDIPASGDSKIVDMWCIANALGCSGADNAVTVKSNIAFCLIIRDNTGEPSYFERTYDFESKLAASLPERFDLKCGTDVTSCTATVTADGVEVRAELAVSADVIEQTVQRVITGAEFGDEKHRLHKPSSVIVYFASDGERLWDVAQRYSTSPEAIAKVNSLSGDVIPSGKTLVIPSV